MRLVFMAIVAGFFTCAQGMNLDSIKSKLNGFFYATEDARMLLVANLENNISFVQFMEDDALVICYSDKIGQVKSIDEAIEFVNQGVKAGRCALYKIKDRT